MVLLCHSDHLGGANWITDGGGKPVQHLQYLPFGERYIDQHPFGYQERFTFTGKERDEETGYGYFGARYMDHELMTMWLSVDPMADKYPSISPYAYCAWNPVKLVDPDGLEVMDNDDEWKVDKLNRTISRVGLNGGNSTQFVEGDGVWIRNESRGDLLNDYKGYTVIDNMSSEAQLNPTEEREKTDAISAGAIAGTIVSSVGQGSRSMSKALFDKENGTYMGKDGSTKPIMQGKNGGLNGRYKSQIKAAAKYAKLGRVCTAAGLATALVSADNTERQYKNGQISNGERWTNHAIDIIGCTPIGCMAPFTYDLGGKYGPSTWFKK